jgi:hypothetical protein
MVEKLVKRYTQSRRAAAQGIVNLEIIQSSKYDIVPSYYLQGKRNKIKAANSEAALVCILHSILLVR